MRKITNTTRFLLPGLGVDLKHVMELGFENSYLNDEDHEPKHKYAVYLLFKVKDNEMLGRFMLVHEMNIIDEYDPVEGYTILVFRFPERWSRVYDLFIQGKYSKFPVEYLKYFPTAPNTEWKSVGLTKSLSLSVCTKAKELKDFQEKSIGISIPEDMELWDIPNYKEETLFHSIFNNNEDQHRITEPST